MTFTFDDATKKHISDCSSTLRAHLTEIEIAYVEINDCNTRLTWADFERAGFSVSEDKESIFTSVGAFASGDMNGEGITLSVYI